MGTVVQLKQGVGSLKLIQGVGGVIIKEGGCVPQKELLNSLERLLGTSAIDTSVVLGTNYTTYKFWKNEKRKMTGPTVRLIMVFFHIAGTKTGKLFGI